MSIYKGNLKTKTGNNTSDILYSKTSIDQVVGMPIPTSVDGGKYLGVDSGINVQKGEKDYGKHTTHPNRCASTSGSQQN